MSTLGIVKVLIFFNLLAYFTVCNTDPLLTFTGCDVTLQWNIGNSSYREKRIYFRITGNAGDVIATEENNLCTSKNNISMSCILSHTNEDWIIVLTLMNITTNHTGNYTAWLRDEQLLHFVKKTTTLIVIDKPRITELWKPVLYKSFLVMCTTSYTSDCITYYWKINGSNLQDSINLYATMSTLIYRNVTMMDNFSSLTCQARLDKCSNILCNSSEDSDPYTVEPYYGPMYVSLTHNESHIYLDENATFKVKCSANCYPACAFRWESYYMNVDNEELVINNFNERLSGPYTCTATNLETGSTATSYPIFLVHAKVSLSPGESQGLRPEQYWTGPITVSIFLLIVGFVLFIIHWRKNASREIERERLKERQRNSREYPGRNLQEEKYSKIDEGVLSVYEYARDNIINGNSHDTESITEHSFYDYASPIETCRVEVADIHVTFENYITPVHDPISPIEMCDNGEIDMLGTDQSDVTRNCELAHSINAINVHDSDLSYITPII
ncbi:hypothetical protein ACJMK2_026336 [Sinanodonta woodiana]|uniref:Ig-like domain-containing protein n=1 Tax=Sinanodonta woodiana TaxID=1069815 RepID=A0ABD3XL51_SINWO